MYRVLLFAFVPALAAADCIINAIRLLLQALSSSEFFDDKRLMALYWLHGVAGAKAKSINRAADERDDPPVYVRLTDVDNVRDLHMSRCRWTWNRVGRIAAVSLALAQAVGTMIMFFRRLDEHAALGFDGRNFWAAIGSTVSSLAALVLLITGGEWKVQRSTVSPELERGPIARLVVTLVFAEGLQEWVSETFGSRDFRYNMTDLPHYRVSFVRGLWHLVPDVWRLFELSVVLVVLLVFREELARRLKVRPHRMRWLALIAICVWAAVDVIVLLEFDIHQLVLLDKDSVGRWQDPLSDAFPVI